MSEHLALCRRVDASGWLTMAKGQSDWAVTSATMQSLDPMLEASLDKLAQHPGADFTFSTLDAKALIGGVVEIQPTADEFSRMLLGRSITILAPIGGTGYPDLWCQTWRDPRGNLSHSGRFVGRLVIDEMRRWVEFFTASKIEKGRAGELDLYVRRDWSAAAFFPVEDFPPPKPFPTKSPEEKSKAEADEEFKRASRLQKKVLASKGYKYSQATRSWRPPAGE